MKVSDSESPTGLPRLQPMRERIMINKSAALSFLETSNIKHVLDSVFRRLALHNLHILYLRERCPVSMAQTHRKTRRGILGHHSPESRVEDLVCSVTCHR